MDNPEDTRYADLNAHQNVELSYTNTGAILNHVEEFFLDEMKTFGESDAQTMAEQYVARCAAVELE